MSAERKLAIGSGILGILGFIGTLVSWSFGDTAAMIVTIALTLTVGLLYWLIWLTLQVKRLSSQYTFQGTNLTPRRMIEEFADPVWVSLERHNHISTKPGFLNWDQCTILINVLVPDIGVGLRDAPDNRYIFAYCSGDPASEKEINRFSLRYSSRNQWELDFTNSRAQRHPQGCLFMMDGLDRGWHQFVIAWDKKKPELLFMIDKGTRGKVTCSEFLNYWPEKYNGTFTVGAWVSAYPNSYVETKLANFWVYRQFLDASSPIVQQHKALFEFQE